MKMIHEQQQADLERWAAAYKGSDGDKYLKGRGIPTETAERYGIGYNEADRRIIIPTTTGYNARAIDDGREPKYKGNIGEKGIFPANWTDIITHNEPEPALYLPEAVFITEGEINALSIMEATGYGADGVGGYGAIAMGGTGGFKKIAQGIIDMMNSGAQLRPFILVPDNDTPKEGETDGVGVKAMRKLAELFNMAQVDYCFWGDADSCGHFDVLDGYNDANEALTADRYKFTRALLDAAGDAPGEIKRKRNAYFELAVGSVTSMANFDKYLASRASRAHISTGIKQLDNLLGGGLEDRFYVVAAASSYGKTSFCLQMAESIAEAETDVLFFAMEMGRNELIGKGISRRSYLNAHHTDAEGRAIFYSGAAATLQTILDSVKTPPSAELCAYIDRARIDYQRSAANLFIIEVGVGASNEDERLTVDFIRGEIERHIAVTGRSPVVIIDYLQLLEPAHERDSDKQNMDYTSKQLRRIVREKSIPVIAISSISRGAYYKPIDKDSLKESGDIEFTADVIIGIEPRGLLVKAAQTNSREEEKTGKTCYSEATGKDQNAAEIIIAKNRGGVTSGIYKDDNDKDDSGKPKPKARDVVNVVFEKRYGHFIAVDVDE
jgi:replicative DNA helicase